MGLVLFPISLRIWGESLLGISNVFTGEFLTLIFHKYRILVDKRLSSLQGEAWRGLFSADKCFLILTGIILLTIYFISTYYGTMFNNFSGLFFLQPFHVFTKWKHEIQRTTRMVEAGNLVPGFCGTVL